MKSPACIVSFAVSLCAVACGGASHDSGAASPNTGRSTGAGENRHAARDPAMTAYPLGEVPAGTYGPYLGERNEGSLAAWAARQGEGRQWFVRALDARGKPQGEPRKLTAAAVDVGLAAVRPLSAGDGKGFVIITTSREFGGERVDAMAVGMGAELRGGPTRLAQSLPEVVWVDAIPTERGAIAFWAAKRGDRASVHAVELGPAGEPRGDTVEVLTDVRAWQVAPARAGAAVAGVTAEENRSSGRVVVAFVDEKARRESAPQVVHAEPTADFDLDFTQTGEKYVLAWSDSAGFEPRVTSAVVGADGKLARAAKPITPPFGPQALIRLVPPNAPGSRAYIAWENLVERPEYGRMIRVAPLNDAGEIETTAGVIDFAAADGGVPELAATADGIATITLAPACRRGAACTEEHVVPTFAALNAQMEASVSEPIRLESLNGRVADLAWGLHCDGTRCRALAAEPTSPAPVFAVELRGLSKDWAPAARRFEPPPAPRVVTIEPIATTDSVFDMSATKLGERTLVAWVTYFDPETPYEKPKTPAPDGRYAPVRALLNVVSLGAGRQEKPEVISYRARSHGGVSLAAASDGSKTALLGWSALEQQVPQVFVTLLSADGKKGRQRMLTHGKKPVHDVAVADANDGWVVAWIDERDGAPEVFVTKVDRNLSQVVPERRVTHSAGNVSAVRLLSRGDHVFAVWSDARGHERGISDLFGVRLSAKDASPVGTEQQLTRTTDNSHSPALAPFGDGAVLGWIEERAGAGDSSAHLMLARLDSGAEMAAPPVRVPVEPQPRSLAITCADGLCRIVAAKAGRGNGAIDAFVWEPGVDVKSRVLVSLVTPMEDPPAPVLFDDDAVYADTTDQKTTHLRRINIEWNQK